LSLSLSAPTLADELVLNYATTGVLFFFAIIPVNIGVFENSAK